MMKILARTVDVVLSVLEFLIGIVIFLVAGLIILSAISACIHAATITSTATGNWADGGTWVGGVAPGDGDSAVLANGHTVTIAASTVVTVGTSPATGGTSAIACSTTSGTGALVIGAGAELIYRGPVKLCTNTAVGAGAILTHDSSAASAPSTSNYPWQQSQINGLNSTLQLNGTSGSRITIRIAASSGNSGGFQGPATSTTDSGLMVGAYVDFQSGCGTTTIFCIYSLVSTRTFDLQYSTFVGSGQVVTGRVGAASVWRFNHNSIKSGLVSSPSKYIFQYGINTSTQITAKTSGTREMIGNYIEDGVWRIWADFDIPRDPGLKFQDNVFYFRNSGGTIAGPLSNYGPPQFADGDWSDNLTLIELADGDVGFPNSYPPGGVLRRQYALYARYVGASYTCNPSNINYHFEIFPTGPVVARDWVVEPNCGGSGEGDGFQLQASDTWPVTFPQVFTGNIFLPGSDGVGYSIINYTSGGARKPYVVFANNTAIASNYTGACGVSGEAAGFAGLFVQVVNNIFWQPSSGNGCYAGYVGQPPAGTYAGPTNYNWNWNVTGGTQYRWSATGAYTTAPGANDTNNTDPQFVDSTANFLGWCQSIDASLTTWPLCMAKFALRGTASEDSRYKPEYAINYIRERFKPKNTATRTAGINRDQVGAVEVPAVKMSGGMVVSGGVIAK